MGNSISLFEKLTDEDPEASFEKVPKRFSTLQELQSSIGEDLSRLLNTRVATLWRSQTGKITTPFAYGINITAPTSAENVFEIQELEMRIDNIIKQFEPRLINAKSHVVSFGTDPSILFINIEATVETENRKIPLSFPVIIGSQYD